MRSQTLPFLLRNSTRYFPPPAHGGQNPPILRSRAATHSTYLPKKHHDRFLRDPLVDPRWSELSLEGPCSSLRPSPELPSQLLHHIHSPAGRARLVQPMTTRRESRRTRLDYSFCRPLNNLMAPGDEGNIGDRNYPYSGLRAPRRQRP